MKRSKIFAIAALSKSLNFNSVISKLFEVIQNTSYFVESAGINYL